MIEQKREWQALLWRHQGNWVAGIFLLLTESDQGVEEESWNGMSGLVRCMPIADWLTASPSNSGEQIIKDIS